MGCIMIHNTFFKRFCSHGVSPASRPVVQGDPGIHKESGISLILVILVLVGLTIIGLATWFLTRDAINISGNIAYKNALQTLGNYGEQKVTTNIGNSVNPTVTPIPAWPYGNCLRLSDNQSTATAPLTSTELATDSPLWTTPGVSVNGATANSCSLLVPTSLTASAPALQSAVMRYLIEYMGSEPYSAPGIAPSTAYDYRITLLIQGTDHVQSTQQIFYQLVVAKP